MILYGSVTRGAGSHSWKEAFFALRLVPSSIPRASGFGLTAYGSYLSSSQCQNSKLVSVTFLPPCQMWASGWGTPLMADGTPAPLHASPWVLLGEHGNTAGKLAFPKTQSLSTPKLSSCSSALLLVLGVSCFLSYYRERAIHLAVVNSS